MIRSILKPFAICNRAVSNWQKKTALRLFDRRSGGRDFRDRVLPGLLQEGQRVLDVGGGKHPAIDLATKRRLELYIVGLDIDADELKRAPEGVYDDTVVGDVAEATIPGQYDLIISKTVLEHTQQNERVIANLAGSLGEGGTMAHFIPCKNALFARINLLLGNNVSRKILFALQPEKKTTSGFKAYYEFCTPSQMSRLCEENGLQVDRLTAYFSSDYCSFFAPLYTLDIMRQLLMKMLCPQDMAENFIIIASKPVACSKSLTADQNKENADNNGFGQPDAETTHEVPLTESARSSMS